MKSEKATRGATSLKPKEVERLLQTAKDKLGLADHALIFTAVRAGLREGETAALQWADVQFGEGEDDDDRYIVVQRNYDRRWPHKMLTPKSRKPQRVDLCRELRHVLLQLRDERFVKAFAEGKSDISDELVFPSVAGTPIEMNNFSERVFKTLLSRAGLRKIRFHDLRHSYGSFLIQAGASLAYIRDQMRHSSIQVTVDIYGHLIPGANLALWTSWTHSSVRNTAATKDEAGIGAVQGSP